MKFFQLTVLLALCCPAVNAQGLLLTTGHQSAIYDIALSADGRYMLTAGNDNVALLWDLASGRELRTFRMPEAGVREAEFVPGKLQIVTHHVMEHERGSNYITLWDMVTGKKIWVKPAGRPTQMIMSPDGQCFFSGGSWYNTENGEKLNIPVKNIENVQTVYGGIIEITWDDEHRSFELTALDTKTGRVTGTIKTSITESYYGLGSVAMSPDKTLIVVTYSGFNKYKYQVWDLKTGRLKNTVNGGYHTNDDKLLISPDNKTLLVAAKNGTLTALNLQTGDTLYKTRKKEYIYELCITPDGKQFASYDGDYRKIIFRDVATGRVVRTITGHSSPVTDIHFSVDGKTIITSHAFEGRKGWDIKTGAFIPHVPDYLDEGDEEHDEHPNLVLKKTVRHRYESLYEVYENYGIVVNRETKSGLALIAVDSTDWLMYDGKGYLDGSPAALKKLYAVDGLRIIDNVTDSIKKYRRPGLFLKVINGGGPFADKPVEQGNKPKIFVQPIPDKTPTPELRAKVVKGGRSMPEVKIFLNGHIIVEDAREVFGFNTSGALLRQDTMYIAVPFSKYKNEPYVYRNKKNVFEIKVYNENNSKVVEAKEDVPFIAHYVEEPKMLLPIGHVGFYSQVAITANGRLAATAQHNIKLWDIKTGREIHTFDLKGGWVRNLQFSGDGKFLIARYDAHSNDMMMAINNEYMAKMWNIETRQEVSLPYADDAFASFSEDGRYFISRVHSVVKDMATGKEYALPKGDDLLLPGVSFSADGKTAAITTYEQKGKPQAALVYWDLIAGKEISKSVFQYAVSKYVYCSPNAKWMVTLEANLSMGRVFTSYNCEIWQPGGKKPVRIIGEQHGVDGLVDISFGKNEDSVYTVDRSGRLFAWSIADGGKREILSVGLQDGFYKFYRPGNSILIGRINSAEVRDVATGQLKLTLKGAVVHADRIAIGEKSNSFIFASTGDKWVKHFKFIPGEPLTVFQHQQNIDRVVYSKDEKYLLTHEIDGNAYIWSSENGRLLRTLGEDGYHVKEASISRDNKRAQLMLSKMVAGRYTTKVIDIESGENLGPMQDNDWYERQLGNQMNRNYTVGTGGNGIIGFGNWHNNESLASLVALDSCDWVMYTKDGYYMASKNGAGKISFEINKKQYLFDQFDLRYNRPDKVLERTGAPREIVAAYHSAYLKRIEKMDFDSAVFEQDWVYNAPQLQVLPGTIQQQGNLYTFKISAQDSLYKLNRILLSVNGVPVPDNETLFVKSRNSRQLQQQLQLALSAGHNDIRISVMNEKGVESLSEVLEAEYEAAGSKPNLYILAIGAGKYIDKKMNLNYAAKDAADVVNLFSSKSAEYGRTIPILLQDSLVTPKNVLTQAQQLLQSTVDDKVVVFYAGHGMYDRNNDYYLGCYRTGTAQAITGSLAYDSLEALLGRVPSRHKVLLLDACYSGERDKSNIDLFAGSNALQGNVKMDRGSRGNDLRFLQNFGPFDLMKNTFPDLRKGSGATVLAASGAQERAGEYANLQNGAFTYCLKNALEQKNADSNKDGKVVLSELLRYLQSEVPRITQGQQRPVSRIENIYQDFDL